MKKNFNKNREQEKNEFDRNILDLARVTRVTKGGKQMSFRACVVLGDHNGQVGMGLEKGKDVQIAVDKAVRQARKNMIFVPIVHDTIPHAVAKKLKAARVVLMPAPTGSGIIAGGAVRVILNLAGVPNVSAKLLSKTKNKVSVAKVTLEALQGFKNYKQLVAENRPKVKPVAPTNNVAKPVFNKGKKFGGAPRKEGFNDNRKPVAKEVKKEVKK